MHTHTHVDLINVSILLFFKVSKINTIFLGSTLFQRFPSGSEGKESACNVRDPGLILESGRSLEEGNGNPLQYSCLENPIDRGAWWAIVHSVTKRWT